MPFKRADRLQLEEAKRLVPDYVSMPFKRADRLQRSLGGMRLLHLASQCPLSGQTGCNSRSVDLPCLFKSLNAL